MYCNLVLRHGCHFECIRSVEFTNWGFLIVFICHPKGKRSRLTYIFGLKMCPFYSENFPILRLHERHWISTIFGSWIHSGRLNESLTSWSIGRLHQGIGYRHGLNIIWLHGKVFIGSYLETYIILIFSTILPRWTLMFFGLSMQRFRFLIELCYNWSFQYIKSLLRNGRYFNQSIIQSISVRFNMNYHATQFVLKLNLTCDITLRIWDLGGVNLIFVVSHTTNHFQFTET